MFTLNASFLTKKVNFVNRCMRQCYHQLKTKNVGKMSLKRKVCIKNVANTYVLHPVFKMLVKTFISKYIYFMANMANCCLNYKSN